jgi:hypothetical protein
MSRQRKRDAVLRLLRGEDLETVSRALGVTAATLTTWRDSFLAAGEAALASRTWRAPRATIYRHQAPPWTEPSRRRGPVGPMPDAALLQAIRAACRNSVPRRRSPQGLGPAARRRRAQLKAPRAAAHA